MTSLFVFILSRENWMYFPEVTLSSLPSISTWTVFSYQIQEITVNRVFYNVVLVPRELPAAASTSFSEENYVMILFSEYRIALKEMYVLSHLAVILCLICKKNS